MKGIVKPQHKTKRPAFIEIIKIKKKNAKKKKVVDINKMEVDRNRYAFGLT